MSASARKRVRPTEPDSKAPTDAFAKRVKTPSSSAAVAAAPPKVKAGGVVSVSAIEAIGRIDRGVREAQEKPVPAAAPPPPEVEVDMKELFRKTARQIQDLGATALTGSVKREWDSKRTVELGGKAAKNIKTPINILRGMRAKAKEREEKRVERERAQGLDPRPKASPSSQSHSRKGSARSDLPVPSTVGRFSKGILTLSRHDVARIQSTDRRPPSLAKAFKRR